MAARPGHIADDVVTARRLPRGTVVLAFALGAWALVLATLFVVVPFLAQLFSAI